MTLEAEPVSPGEALSGKLSGKLNIVSVIVVSLLVLLKEIVKTFNLTPHFVITFRCFFFKFH